MADMLQMSYQDMEALASAFTQASGDLDGLSSGITGFLSEISAQIDAWKGKVQELSGTATDIRSTLDGVEKQTRSTWQGDQAEKFDGTYEQICNTMQNLADNLANFTNSLASVYSNLEAPLTDINKSVSNESNDCSENSSWISQYKADHQAIG